MRNTAMMLGVAAVLGSTSLAGGTALVSVIAQSDVASIERSSTDDPALAGAAHVTGRASAAGVANASVVSGSPPACGSFPGCPGATVPIPRANSFASANGTDGTLRTSAIAANHHDAFARGAAALIDTVSLSSPVIRLRLDIDALSGSMLGSPDWIGTIDFRLYVPGTGLESDPDVDLFRFTASRTPGDSSSVIGRLRNSAGGSGLVFEETLVSGVAGFSEDLDLGDIKFFDGHPVPSIFPIGGSVVGQDLELAFSLVATADCSSTSDCFVQADADGTLYIGLEGVSASGYRYPGFAVDPPPPDGVPTPASWLLLASGLATLAWRRQARANARR